MGRDDFVASAAYQPEPTAVAAARRFVRDTLGAWVAARGTGDGHGLVDDAVLLTSELVTNAVVHARTAVQVVCRLAGDEVEVVVTDGDPGRMVPGPRPDEGVPAERTSGRGLLLPASLASAWGVTYERAAKAVWFRLGLSGEAPGLSGGAPGLSVGVSATGYRDSDGAGDGAAAWLNGVASGRAKLTAALRQVPLVVSAATGADAGAPPPAAAGEDGYEALLKAAVESARALLGAEASYAMMPGEDGDLGLRAASGRIPATGGEEARQPARGATGQRQAALRTLASTAPSVVTAPFVVDGRVTGLLSVASAVPGRFADGDAVRLQRLADRWGPALDRARLVAIERARRGRLSALASTRALLAGQVSRDEAMVLVARAAVPRLAPWCAVLLPGDGGLRPALVRHVDAGRTSPLRILLGRAAVDLAAEGWPPSASARGRTGAPGPMRRWPLAASGLADAADGESLEWEDACCFPLGPGGPDGRDGLAGVFVIGCGHQERLAREVAELAADLACRLGIAMRAGREPAREQPAGRDGASAGRDGAGAGLPAGR